MARARGGSGSASLGARLFAAPAARLTLAVAAGVLAVALLAGAVRVLPLLLAPGVPPRLAPVLARGVIAVALEAALFVAPPIGWALAAARLVERGEARALHAAGLSPLGIVARGWPAAIAVISAAGLAAGLWGREARAPGRALRDLLLEARAACASAPPPAVAEVPMLGVSWVCLSGEPPRAIIAAPGGLGAIAAASLTPSDDLARLDAGDLQLLIPAAGDRAEARVTAARATVRGIAPIGRASNLSVAARVIVLSVSSALLAAAAAAAVLRRGLKGRVASSVAGASAAGASLLVFSSLEAAPSAPLLYASVPIAGLFALALAARLAPARPS